MSKCFLGIDVGSVSLKFVLMDNGNLIGKTYLRNQGLISTVQEGLRQLPKVKISGVGVTGSGKEFVKSFVGADYVDSEIISHMVACLKEYPDARTILDIGGEDSKLMLVNDSVLSDFQMNRDCGGGTGAMIETIANRLGVSIEEAGSLALKSKDPAILPGKCGIFCQSSVVSQINKGRPVEDILMGVCRALVGNYLAVLTKGKNLEHPIVFQGATAQNKALVKCFEDILGKPILVPENCCHMGAIGIAMLTQEMMNGKVSSFRGDCILDQNYQTGIAHCHECENNCELLTLLHNGKVLAVSGSHCGEKNK